jgi:hypothetical protein
MELAAAFMIEAIVWGFPNAYGIFLDGEYFLRIIQCEHAQRRPPQRTSRTRAMLLKRTPHRSFLLSGRYHLESFIVLVNPS